MSLWTTRHRSGQTIVADCYVVTEIGHRSPWGTRGQPGLAGPGPGRLVTELAIFDFDPRGRARLRALFPGVTFGGVQSVTGFDIEVDQPPPAPRPPSTAELAAVRAVDPQRHRAEDFADRELQRAYSLDEAVCAYCM